MLRAIRITALVLICALAGIYAGRLFWPAGPAPVPAEAAETPLVATLPDFELQDLAGELRGIAEWRGRPLVINFWATWCRPCREEMPLLQALHEQRSTTGPVVIGVAVDRRPDVEAYITESGISYPILLGQQDAMDAAERFGPPFVGLPFTVLVGGSGAVLGMHRGELDRDELRELVRIADAVEAGTLDPTAARARMAALDGAAG